MSSTVCESVAADSLITLRRGLVVRINAIRLVLDLEARGVRFERDGNDIVFRAPAFAVTAEDRESLRAHKPAILQLLDYRAEVH